jgi:hypothetical protein
MLRHTRALEGTHATRRLRDEWEMRSTAAQRQKKKRLLRTEGTDEVCGWTRCSTFRGNSQRFPSLFFIRSEKKKKEKGKKKKAWGIVGESRGERHKKEGKKERREKMKGDQSAIDFVVSGAGAGAGAEDGGGETREAIELKPEEDRGLSFSSSSFLAALASGEDEGKGADSETEAEVGVSEGKEEGEEEERTAEREDGARMGVSVSAIERPFSLSLSLLDPSSSSSDILEVLEVVLPLRSEGFSDSGRVCDDGAAGEASGLTCTDCCCCCCCCCC